MLFIGEMQIKEISPHTGQYGHQEKNLQTINTDEGVEKRELSCTVDGNKLIQPKGMEKRMERMRYLGRITDSMDISLSKLWR